ncbi:MAG: thiamine phosphate synthase [Bacteroidetes bacterium CG_4_10_14_3_um_filter_31_20]|nr:MAG: thiamine phosphate synthase [Bacteroidetes bacterium CG_4_10_14_3_um_filter_31_20]
MYSKLQYISQGSTPEEQFYNINSTLDAGCKWIQLRFKNCEKKQLINLTEKIKKLCSLYNSTLIINDNVDIAKIVDIHGVHLGLKDMPVRTAREILGEDKIIGGTANTLIDVLTRINEGCNYIGIGPYRFTTTKEKLSPILGLDGINRIMNTLTIEQRNVPVYAIGGIQHGDIDDILKTGVYGVAISGLITLSNNKKETIEILNSLL